MADVCAPYPCTKIQTVWWILQTHVLEAWRGYTDEAAFIFAETDGEPHNTITPIARKVRRYV